MVTNDVAMGEDGRIGILTGPNQGGKTTYTQMVGLCQSWRRLVMGTGGASPYQSG